MEPGSGPAGRAGLVDAAWVHEHRGDPRLRTVDCGGSEAFRRAHLPGAVGLAQARPGADHPLWLKDAADPHAMIGADGLAELLGRLGVGDDTTVVAYDDADGLYAARLWWTLRCHGHAGVRLLDGGWRRWTGEGRPVELGEAAAEPAGAEPGRWTPAPRPGLRCGASELRDRLGEPGLRVLDVRSRGEWTGRERGANPRGGHLPGAVHLEWTRLLRDDGSGRFRPAGELGETLRAAGLDPEAETVVYCQAAVRAAHTAFALERAGWRRVRVLEGSMAEWAARADTPLVEEPG